MACRLSIAYYSRDDAQLLAFTCLSLQPMQWLTSKPSPLQSYKTVPGSHVRALLHWGLHVAEYRHNLLRSQLWRQLIGCSVRVQRLHTNMLRLRWSRVCRQPAYNAMPAATSALQLVVPFNRSTQSEASCGVCSVRGLYWSSYVQRYKHCCRDCQQPATTAIHPVAYMTYLFNEGYKSCWVEFSISLVTRWRYSWR